jgi:Ca2+-binding RTX toxin-like protein
LANGGNNSVNGTASATTAAGQLAQATATANTGAGAVQATATTTTGISSVVANAQGPVGGSSVTAYSLANGGADKLFDPTSSLTAFNVLAASTAAPSSVFAFNALSANSNVKAQLGGATADIFAAGVEGASYSVGGPHQQEYKSTQAWTIDASKLSGHLILGLIGAPGSFSGLSTLEFSVVVAGQKVLDQGFTSQSAAASYFTNNAIDLGAITSAPGLTVSVSFDLKLVPGQPIPEGFNGDYLLGSTGSSVAAPTLSGGGNTVFYPPGPGNVTIDNALTTASATGQLQGATVSIGTGFLAGDALNFTAQSGITGSYNATTGVLSLSGTATTQQYATALDSITFSSTATDPSSGGADASRTVSWVVSDGSQSSSAVTSTVSINASSGQTFTLTTGVDHVTGGAANDVVQGTALTLTKGDVIDGGGGTNTLALQGGGTFKLTGPKTLANMQLVTATEGAGADEPVILLRPLQNITLNVASGTEAGGGVKITGANDASVINLGGGVDTVTLGSATETVHGGGGPDTFAVTSATIGATIDGGTGASVLVLTDSGPAVMGANITNVHKVTLKLASTFTANATPQLTVTGSAGNDTITAGGASQTLTGGAGADTLIGAAGGGDTFADKTANLNGDTIQGFAAPGDAIDITDMKAKGAILTYSGGVLKVVNGALSASINLTGTFTQSDFALGKDARGDVLITQSGGSLSPDVQAFVQSISAFPTDSTDSLSTAPITQPGPPAPISLTAGH